MVTPVEKKASAKVGAVLVIGGGIAGIQAALDLAESGQKAYLLESSPAIGGNMARLDKTFPTNDCAMCILSPKIVECGRHINIETITWSEIERVTGQAGDFTVQVRRRARFVDVDKCTGCAECAEVCPVTTGNEFDADLGKRGAIYRPCPQAFPNAFVIEKKGKSPCRIGCPAGININAYVVLTGAGRFDEALDSILETVPLPGVLGRVCDHPCEAECQVGNFGQPVAICAIKRFLADRRRAERPRGGAPAVEREQNLAKVAIVGSGPAGLTAGRELARLGYHPTIFEERPIAGGMLAYGIPDYRLPSDVLVDEIQDVLDEGVELKLNTRIGTDTPPDGLRAQGYEALILAVGAQKGVALGIEGENLRGATDSIAFLHEVNAGERSAVSGQVAVIGGGNSAIDAARSALRLGAAGVTVVYRRSRAEMPAISAEVEAAEQEGVLFHYLAAPERVIGRDDRVVGLACIRMQLGEADASGRRRPLPIPGSQFVLDADMVISAIGQKVVVPGGELLSGLRRTRRGMVQAGDEDAATNLDGVFAAGDAVTGPASVIDAIAGGRRAAHAVDCYLRGEPFEPLTRVTPADVVDEPPTPDQEGNAIPRQHAPELAPQLRITDFTEVEAALSEEQALTEASRCLKCAGCSECMACVKVCKANAICHDQQDVLEDIHVGAILVMPGFEEFLSTLRYDLGYSRYEDVVSSIQFERILSASGPFAGHVQRLSDGKTPRSIAFLQCVGSRDVSCRNLYCSSVCCMYAIKEAVIAKEHVQGVDVTIFFMDIRAFGKDFDRYYERAADEYGVEFVRARVSDVARFENDGSLIVRYAPESGCTAERAFDMVVLSVGLEPPPGLAGLGRKLGVKLDEYGFIWTDPRLPVATSRPGVFAAGVACGPKDIPETVVQASAAACQAGGLLASACDTLTLVQEFPPERDVSSEPPHIGVFVCHCGINIGGVVDVPAVTEYARTLPNVVYAEDNLYTCSQDTQNHIREMVQEHGLNRVVVASCSPRTHEPLFQQTLREAGLNANLFAMTNIRDQCSWTHRNVPEAATDKARDLVRMAIAKARLIKPLQAETIPVVRKALVLGGGWAGMTAAIAIAEHGYGVFLVEKEAELGGNLRHLYVGFDGQDLRSMLAEAIERIERHPLISVFTSTTATEIDGFVGNFRTTLGNGRELEHGVAVIATGADEYSGDQYLYGADPRVVTQRELQAVLDGPAEPAWATPPECIVMIQCVGSRDDERPYCSRVCCTRAIVNAIRIKELWPNSEVFVLYRDIRTYGFNEAHYRQARELGVLFIRFDKDAPPLVSSTPESVNVKIREPIVDAELELRASLLVLSTGIAADSDANDRLAKLFKVPINDDGFFLEAHVKLRPVEFASEGVFVAGLAHAPKGVAEATDQALAAASRACTVLQKEEIEAQATIAEVQAERCMACGLCESVCAYGAVALELQRIGREERIFAKVNPALCKGCGACVAGCRSGAINLRGFTDQQILAEILQLV